MSETTVIANPANQSTFFKKITKNPPDQKTIRNFLNEMKDYFRVAYMEPTRLTAGVFKDFVPEDTLIPEDKPLTLENHTPFHFSMSAFEWVEVAYPDQTNETDENGRENSQVVINAVLHYLEWSEHQALIQLVNKEKLALIDHAKVYYDANAEVASYNQLSQRGGFNSFKAAVKEALGNDFEESLWSQYNETQKAISNATRIVNIARSLPGTLAKFEENLMGSKGQGKNEDNESLHKNLLGLLNDYAVELYNALNRVDKSLINYGDRHFKGFGFGYLANQVLYLYNCLNNAYTQWQEERAAKKAEKIADTPRQPLL